MKYELNLSHGMYNAGVLGLIRILENSGKKKFIKTSEFGDTVVLDTESLLDFEIDYYNYFKTIYGKKTSTYKLIYVYKSMNIDDENFEEKFLDWEKKYITKINQKAGAYASGYVIVKNEFKDDFNVTENIKNAKKEKVSNERYILYQGIVDYLDKYRDVFIYKNIAYTILDSYWGNISFFNSSKVKIDMFKSYKNEFIDSINIANDYVDDKGKYECNDCFTRFNKNKLEATGTWLSDIGVDYKRKPSHYWDFKVTEAICPMCKLVYSCVPAGFFTVNRKGLFINVNSSVKDLIEMNLSSTEIAKFDSYESYQDMSYSKLMRHIKISFDQSVAQGTITNVQVIRREGKSSEDLKYYIENLGQLQLILLRECHKELNYYLHRYYEYNEVFLNLYNEIVKAISNSENLYNLLSYLIKTPNSKSKVKKSMKLLQLLTIQTAVSFYRTHGVKGEKKLLETNKKKVYVIYQKGLEMRKSQSGISEEELDNKLKGLIYQLTNALKAQNKDAFMDRLLRLYTSQSKPVPSLFLDVLSDKDALMNYGYAYIIGLKGEEIREQKEA